MSKPLVTFALFGYNQERFVREAVRSALAQTYSPLQVILSDDCSPDGTFEIMREEAARYEGPHRVVLNRNEHNLGLGGHYNRVMELAEGGLIVTAAGDDVSLAERTEEFVKVWSEGGNFSIYSNYVIMDGDGVERGVEGGIAQEAGKTWWEKVRSEVMRGIGCAHAWDRAVFDVFGPLPDDIVQEDVAIPFRASLLGRVAYIDECLARYRRHDTNIWKRRDDLLRADLPQYMEHQLETAQTSRTNLESWMRDLQTFSSLHPEMESELREAREIVAARMEFYNFKIAAFMNHKSSDRVRGGLRALRGVGKLGVGSVVKVGLLAVSPLLYSRIHQRQYRKRTPDGPRRG